MCLYREHFKAKVCPIWVHGPFGKVSFKGSIQGSIQNLGFTSLDPPSTLY